MILKHSEDETELLVHQELLFVSLVVFAQLLRLAVVFEGLLKLSKLHIDMPTQPVGEILELEVDGAIRVLWEGLQ